LRVSGMTGLGARSAVSSRHACEDARWGLHRSRAIGRRGTPSARRRERGEGRARARGRRRVSRRARTDAYLVRGAHDARTRLAQWSGGLGRGEQRHALFEVVSPGSRKGQKCEKLFFARVIFQYVTRRARRRAPSSSSSPRSSRRRRT
jgi:hypothetical protein